MKFFDFQLSRHNKLYDLLKSIGNKKIIGILFGGMIGAVTGWLYWEFIGCSGGSCPITSGLPQTIIIFSLFGMWYNFKK